ncbi:hypothetical protein GJ496_009217 [Pomphorhynchus laevis]|nr:hypothetical protein GJ496_009217 [Pomphorhynchus laevis]
MFLLTLLISILNITVVLVTSNRIITFGNNDNFVRNIRNNAFQTNKIDAIQECEECDYQSYILCKDESSVDENILCQSFDSKVTKLAFSENLVNSDVVVTVNKSGDITCKRNVFKSNALMIVNAWIAIIVVNNTVFDSDLNIVGILSNLKFKSSDFANNSQLTISEPMHKLTFHLMRNIPVINIKTHLTEFVVNKTVFDSDLNIVGILSNLKIESSSFAKNSQLTISEPMHKLTFHLMRNIPVINIKTHLTELHLVDILYLHFNSKTHPTIENIALYFQLEVYPYPYRYMLSVKNSPTLVLCNIGRMKQNANINCDNEIKQIVIVNDTNKDFNFDGCSSLENLYLHVADSSILIPPSLKKVYITNQHIRANLYVQSIDAEIEIIQFYNNNSNSIVTSTINCYSDSRLRNVNLYCTRILPTVLRELLKCIRAKSSMMLRTVNTH